MFNSGLANRYSIIALSFAPFIGHFQPLIIITENMSGLVNVSNNRTIVNILKECNVLSIWIESTQHSVYCSVSQYIVNFILFQIGLTITSGIIEKIKDNFQDKP